MKPSKTFHLARLLSLISWYSTKRHTLTSPFEQHSKSLNSCSFTLSKDEIFRISSRFREVQVLSGVAWLTVADQDIILKPGEKASIVPNQDIALVSALSDVSLVLIA